MPCASLWEACHFLNGDGGLGGEGVDGSLKNVFKKRKFLNGIKGPASLIHV